MTNFFKFSIGFLFILLINGLTVNYAYAGPCTDAGGQCYTKETTGVVGGSCPAGTAQLQSPSTCTSNAGFPGKCCAPVSSSGKCNCYCVNSAGAKSSQSLVKNSEADCSDACKTSNPSGEVWYICEAISGSSGGGTAPIGKTLLESSNNAKYSSGCISNGDCGLNDFVVVLVRGSEIILGLTGSLALLFFVYGGLMMMISAGSSDKVTKGKNIIIGAVIGMFIVLLSWSIINFILKETGYSYLSTWNSTPK